MDHRSWHWRVRDRAHFIEVLTQTGNPATAAAAIGQTLAAAYAMRDRWPALADDWRRALGIAWEQVEMRLLATLLGDDASAMDSKVALEMLKRRPQPPARPLVTVDAKKIAAIRNEIRALASPDS